MKFPSLYMVKFLFTFGILFSSCSGNILPIGRDTLVTQGKTYRVGETQIEIIKIAVTSKADEQGRENEYLSMQVRAGTRTIWLTDDRPIEVDGMVLTASSVGYKWGESPAVATLRIDHR